MLRAHLRGAVALSLDASVRAILLDIEGTTTPIEFVHDVLFSYARARLQEFLDRHGADPAVAADIALSTVVTALLAFSWLGDGVYGATGGPWWARTVLFTLLVLAFVEAVRLPLGCWRGFVRERRWGFSTQSFGGWALDQAKGFAVGFAVTAAALLALLGSIRAFPTW